MQERPRIVLLAARESGYRSLMRLNSRAFLETEPNEQPDLKLAWLDDESEGLIPASGGPGGALRAARPDDESEGLIALTGGPGGPLDAAVIAGQEQLANGRCDALQRLLGDRLYI